MRVTASGPPYDPRCRICEFGWIDFSDPETGNECTSRCPDCEAKAEVMRVPTQSGPGRKTRSPK